MVIIGGTGTLFGAIVGALLISLLEYYASLITPDRWPLVLGAAFVLGRDVRPRGRRRNCVQALREGVAAMEVLRVERLSKSFDGVRALDDVSFSVRAAERLGIIGPNGAGKSTLFNVLSGVLPPTTGSISLYADDITDLPAHRRARLGLARSFQNGEPFSEPDSVRESLSRRSREADRHGIVCFPRSARTRTSCRKSSRGWSVEAFGRSNSSRWISSPTESSGSWSS